MLDHEERFLFREEIHNLANALADPGAHGGKTYEATGPDAMTMLRPHALPGSRDRASAHAGAVGTALGRSRNQGHRHLCALLFQRGLPPVAGTTKMSQFPFRSEENASQAPSGDQTGFASYSMWLVTG